MLRVCKIIILLCLVIVVPAAVMALPPDHFTEQSRLASGRWVKIELSQPGLYRLTNSTLRQWGFSDPSKVRVFGYDAYRKSDILSAANVIDDLPQVRTHHTTDGIYFYASGPMTFSRDATGSRILVTPSDYSNSSYYFLTESADDLPAQATTGMPGASAPATTFTEVLHYEKELVTPGESGPQLVGEDFKLTPTRTFNFDTEDAAPNGTLNVTCSFVHKSYKSATLQIAANGTTLNEGHPYTISPTTNDLHYYGNEAVVTPSAPYSADRLQLSLTYQPGGTCMGAWLNYLTVNYTRRLRLPASGWLMFHSASRELSLGNAGNDVIIWDVTDPRDIRLVDAATSGDSRVWTAESYGSRTYLAFRPGATGLSASLAGEVANQNLHALDGADMVIITFRQWADQAERLARLHRDGPDSLKVHVVDIEQIYNEFGSGARDASALRWFNKMIYDRSLVAGRPMRYALLMGRGTFDERHNLAVTRSSTPYTIPFWQTKTMATALTDNSGYGTDDFIAMLEDNEGGVIGQAYINLAVGRLPVTTASEAKMVVDMLYDYQLNLKQGIWRNRMMLIADDGNTAIHAKQSERMVYNIKLNPLQQNLFTKIYIDAYEYNASVPTAARTEMFRALDEGVMLWSYIGHGNPYKWSDNDILTYNDVTNFYVRQPPVVYAATCDFMRWDANMTSAGELMFMKRYGGVAAMISAARPVSIAENGYLSNGMGHSLARRDEQGRFYPIGEILRHAKNNMYSDGTPRNPAGTLITSQSQNKLRFSLMGDPAMRLPLPGLIARLDSINGQPVGRLSDDSPQVKARSLSRFAGSIIDPTTGRLCDNFNGTMEYTLYDAESSRSTLDHERQDTIVTYQVPGDRLAVGSAAIKAGRFDFTVAVPEQTAQNWRPATLSMHAVSGVTGSTLAALDDAVGMCSDFYVYDIDFEIPHDDRPPVIESLAINHPSFTVGSTVPGSPTLLARVSDDRGINLSSAGIGRQMTVTVDGRRAYNDVSLYFTPETGDAASGSIVYPLPDLTDGPHTVMLRVWDTDGNYADASTDFIVDRSLAPEAIEVYSDANPARDHANFYVSHNMPDASVEVTVTVYTLEGRPVWSHTEEGRSDMFTSMPVSWDLTDMAGRRVGRGIYIYRATIAVPGGSTHTSRSRKIAVAGY